MMNSQENRDKSDPEATRPNFMKRRDFLDWIIRGGLLITVVGLLAPALVYLWPSTRRGPGARLVEVADEKEMTLWAAKKVVVDGSALLVFRTPNGIKALSAICTHLGCIVEWDRSKRQIECPCHAGYFSAEGNVISGPPPRPLPSYEVQLLEGKVFVRI